MTDLLIRVVVNPEYAPTLILGRFIVRNQVPEYVGAPQKKFAWIIGLVLSSIMLVHIIILNGYGPIAGLTCMVCLAFLFFEAAIRHLPGLQDLSPFLQG